LSISKRNNVAKTKNLFKHNLALFKKVFLSIIN
jgi:hypothetical protein